MYKLLLILKYLRRKLAPMFAALAVMLCTTMVIVVISVMGGFLDHLRDTVHQLSGDVTISAGSLTGFPHYDAMVEELEALPEIAAATPIIRAFGLINLYNAAMPVQIQGIRPADMDEVVDYRESLHWTTQDFVEAFTQSLPPEEDWTNRDRAWIDDHLAAMEQLDVAEYGMTLDPPAAWQPVPETPAPGIVLGIELNPRSVRDANNEYNPAFSSVREPATLTVLPMSQQGSLGAYQPASRRMVVVNEFKSGHYELDAIRAYVRLDVLQRMLEMNEQQGHREWDPITGEPLGEASAEPARVTEIVLRGAPGYSLAEVHTAAAAVADRFMQEHDDIRSLWTTTWEQEHATLLGAVANEKGLVTFLFVLISIVAIVMVATTFYMIVLEKTRDIGVLRAVGASRGGIMNIFLGYGLAIGLVGSMIGLLLAYGITTNLNEIQAFLNTWFGWQMWDPQVYAFDRIPARIDPTEAGTIVIGAILSSVVGALIPALLAARLNPIEALRYE